MTDEPQVEQAPAGQPIPTSLYGWLWSRLPGSRAVKTFVAVLLMIAVVLILFAWVFPRLEPRLPWVDVTVGDSGTGG